MAKVVLIKLLLKLHQGLSVPLSLCVKAVSCRDGETVRKQAATESVFFLPKGEGQRQTVREEHVKIRT